MPPADFGTPPSGEVPILFNDRHVYSKPDRLKANRVLAALVRGNTILIPLRSMFEQMGATVSYDPASKTVDVSKPGSDVKVTVGRPEVVINGESRPLDVPPEIYKGSVVVPVRVISEGMGAYVQWVPDRRIVVVRYVAVVPPTAPPTAPPTMAPTAPPTVAPTPVPTPTPVAKNPYEHFIVGDYVFAPKVYNELSNGQSTSGGSYAVRGAIEFPAFGLPWMIEGNYTSFSYPHTSSIPASAFNAAAPADPCTVPGLVTGNPGCVTVIGYQNYAFPYGQTAVPAFGARDADLDGRFGLKIADPRIYIGVGYINREDNYGYPRQHGFGFGAEKLPDLDQAFSLYGSVWYYPSVTAQYTYQPPGFAGPITDSLQYRDLKYQIGGTISLTGTKSSSGLFLDLGFLGDRLQNKNLAPSDGSHSGAYLGLGLKF